MGSCRVVPGGSAVAVGKGREEVRFLSCVMKPRSSNISWPPPGAPGAKWAGEESLYSELRLNFGW